MDIAVNYQAEINGPDAAAEEFAELMGAAAAASIVNAAIHGEDAVMDEMEI